MKLELADRGLLAQHEAAHVVALHAAGAVSQVVWRTCEEEREICHCAAREWAGEWEDAAARNAAIASNAFVALAGGAWEALVNGQEVRESRVEEIYGYTGAVDFELAHEWLTLQRYDGDQGAIEHDIVRLFNSAFRFLGGTLQRDAIPLIADRLLAAIFEAERSGLTSACFSAGPLLEGIATDRLPLIRLEATIRC